MTPLDFFHPVLKALDEGRIVRTTVAHALRAFAALTLLGGLFLVVNVLKKAFAMPAEGAAAGVLLAALLAAAFLAIAQIYFYRARTVQALGDSPFTVIPVFSVLLRVAGEIYATLATAVAIGGCLFIWLTRINPVSMFGGLGGVLPDVPVGGTFLGGLLFLVYVELIAFAVLIAFYFLAESIVVLAEIAKNTRGLVRQ